MDSLSEQTLSGLSEKEIKQLAKRCPIVLCVTEDVQLDRFEYTDVLETNNDGFLTDLKVDLEDARVSCSTHVFLSECSIELFFYQKSN